MKVKLRLQRIGRRNRPFYRAVASSCSRSRSGKYLEVLGVYDPILSKDNENRLNLKMERIDYWLNVGAQKTKTIDRLIKLFISQKKETVIEDAKN
ncbi:30S ribosomal protein S16 [Anaplasmataceae bacterium AB001_6]|nr:30S ribosomal protein S16 [Anaplasmataceae bacterium AB001_6]